MGSFKNLNEFITFNSEFRNAINIDLNLNHREKLLSYIPTKSSASILKRYMTAIKNNTLHSSMLIGPYGKGKSHLLLVLLAILTLDRNNKSDKEVFEILLQRIKKVDIEAANLMTDIWSDKAGRFLPVIVNCQDDVNQAFLLALNKALQSNGLKELTPKTDYEFAIEIIKNWKENYKDTYDKYHILLKEKKITLNAMNAELLQYNKEYLNVFKEIYPQLTSGSTFNPLVESAITKIYTSVAESLRDDYGYRGIYIIFDEFSKFIEGQDKMSSGINMKLVQDICEMACDSNEPQIYITLVAHKPIKEYSNKLKAETINSFIGIEGRLDSEIMFITSSKNNYELIQNAIIKEESELRNIPDNIYDKIFSKQAIDDNYAIPAFKSEFNRNDFESIVVRGCYPLTPVSSYLLLNISEKVAQNERTLFTFICKDEPNSMAGYIKSSNEIKHKVSDKWFITPELVYDYFSTLFKEENDDIRKIYAQSVTAIEIINKKVKNKELSIKFVKTLAVFMINDKSQELPWNKETMCIALNLNNTNEDRYKFSDIIDELIQEDIISVDGKEFYFFKTFEGKELENVIKERWRLVANDTNIGKELLDLFPCKYVFPKKYNYEYGITRYFRYLFVEVNDFLNTNNEEVYFTNSLFSDGMVLCLYKFDDNDYYDAVKEKIKHLKSHKIIVVYTDKLLSIKEQINKLQVLKDIKEDTTFISKNPNLIAEISTLEDILDVNISSALDDIYGRYGEYDILYYYESDVMNGSDKSISECVDILCHKIYFKTPILNNEFVNRQNISTAATKTARKNIMDKLINNKEITSYLKGTSQDSTIYRSLFYRTGLYENKPQNNVKEFIYLVEEYINSCCGKKEPVSKLLNIVTKEPYGVRLGVIPIYLAYVIGKRNADIVVYYGDREISLNTDTLINMCDYPDKYFLYVSEADAEREMYLQSLCKIFNVKNNNCESRVSNIFKAMQQWYRTLPQVTINSKKDDDYYNEKNSSKVFNRMGKILQRYDINPFEAVLFQIPQLLSDDNNYLLCIQNVKLFKHKLSGYYEWISGRVVNITKEVFNNSNDSLYHIMSEWFEKQSDKAKGEITDQSISAFMNAVKDVRNNGNIKGETEIADNLAKAVIGVYIDYWNSDSLEKYKNTLLDLKCKIEDIHDEEYDDGKVPYISRSGQTFYYQSVENEDTKMFRDILSGTIEDFEGLGKNDIIAILLDEVENILKQE